MCIVTSSIETCLFKELLVFFRVTLKHDILHKAPKLDLPSGSLRLDHTSSFLSGLFHFLFSSSDVNILELGISIHDIFFFFFKKASREVFRLPNLKFVVHSAGYI